MAPPAHRPRLPWGVFLQRWAKPVLAASALLAVSLLLGVAGYHWIGGLSWIDALLNASMILAGMGPVDTLTTPAAKGFAAAYAIFSGVAFLSIMAVVMAPVVHRLLHHFHVDARDGER